MTRRPGLSALALVMALAPAFATAQTAPTSAGNPNLAVATVKLENGTRLAKILGSSVYSDPATQVGTVDDLIMTDDHKITLAVIAVGGFLGLGSKLVAIPYAQLKFEDGKTMLPNATKDSLNGMPNFTY